MGIMCSLLLSLKSFICRRESREGKSRVQIQSASSSSQATPPCLTNSTPRETSPKGMKHCVPQITLIVASIKIQIYMVSVWQHFLIMIQLYHILSLRCPDSFSLLISKVNTLMFRLSMIQKRLKSFKTGMSEAIQLKEREKYHKVLAARRWGNFITL